MTTLHLSTSMQRSSGQHDNDVFIILCHISSGLGVTCSHWVDNPPPSLAGTIFFKVNPLINPHYYTPSKDSISQMSGI